MPEKAIISELNREKGWVVAKSHVFIRGTNTENTILIIDEAQNWTKKDLRKQLTRVHDSCKVIIVGHIGQIDLRKPHLSGFLPFIKLFSNKDQAEVLELSKNFRGWIANTADSIDDIEENPNLFNRFIDRFLKYFNK